MVSLHAMAAEITGYAGATANPQTAGFHKLVYKYEHNGKPHEMSFLMYLPEGYAAKPEKPFGMLVFFSGLGERGSDPQMLFSSGVTQALLKKPEMLKNLPLILVGPQCPGNERYEDEHVGQGIADLVDEICRKYPVDESRLYMTGFSMGGTACWSVARYAPRRFAVIAPIVARVFEPEVVGPAMKHSQTTCLVISGEIDSKSEPGSTEMVKVLREGGVDVVRVMIPLGDHNLWSYYYSDQRFYDWLMSHQNGEPKPIGRLDEQTLIAMAALRTNYNEKWLSKVKADLQTFAPWWQIDNCSDRANPGLRNEFAGKKNVFVMHPYYAEAPCRLQTTTTLPSAKKVTLKLTVGRNIQGDWKLLVRVNEQEVFARVVDKDSAPDQWLSADVDLTPWSGQEVRLQLCDMAYGAFRNEEAYWQQIAIVPGP